MQSDCIGDTSTCVCSDCLRRWSFKESPWFINFQQLSKVEPFLRNNDELPNEHISIAHIQTHLSGVLGELHKIEEEISNFKALLYKLEKHKEAVQALADESSSLLSPFRRFPAELLQEVFLFMTEFDVIQSCDRQNPSPSILSNGPWTISQVCRQWRTTALSCPSLWSKVILDYAPGSECLEEEYAIWIDKGINRACHHGLHVVISTDQGNRFNEVALPGAVTRLLSYSRQITQLDLYLDSSMDFKELFTATYSDCQFLSLEKLNITITDGIFSYGPVDVFNNATSLEEVSLRHGVYEKCCRSSMLRKLSLPWQKVKTFRTNYTMMTEDIAGLLQECRALIVYEHEALSYLASSSFTPGNNGLVQHKTLADLSIPSASLLNWLNAPALQRLEIWGSFVSTADMEVTQRFISLSGCNLQSLEILSLSAVLSHEFLKSLSSLETFIVQNLQDSIPIHQLVSTFTEAHSQAKLLPRLKRFVIQPPPIPWNTRREDHIRKLIVFIHNRMGFKDVPGIEQASPLEYFCYDQFGPDPPSQDSRLATLLDPFVLELSQWVDCGLRIVLQGHMVSKNSSEDGVGLVYTPVQWNNKLLASPEV